MCSCVAEHFISTACGVFSRSRTQYQHRLRCVLAQQNTVSAPLCGVFSRSRTLYRHRLRCVLAEQNTVSAPLAVCSRGAEHFIGTALRCVLAQQNTVSAPLAVCSRGAEHSIGTACGVFSRSRTLYRHRFAVFRAARRHKEVDSPPDTKRPRIFPWCGRFFAAGTAFCAADPYPQDQKFEKTLSFHPFRVDFTPGMRYIIRIN